MRLGMSKIVHGQGYGVSNDETKNTCLKYFAWLKAFCRVSTRQSGSAYSIDDDEMPLNLTGRTAWANSFNAVISHAFLYVGMCPNNNERAASGEQLKRG